MILKLSARNGSLALTTCSLLLGLVNIQLGRRLNYLEHLPIFNSMAAAMLALVVAGLVVACVPLVRARGRSASLWLAAALAIVVLGSLLLDD